MYVNNLTRELANLLVVFHCVSSIVIIQHRWSGCWIFSCWLKRYSELYFCLTP